MLDVVVGGPMMAAFACRTGRSGRSPEPKTSKRTRTVAWSHTHTHPIHGSLVTCQFACQSDFKPACAVRN